MKLFWEGSNAAKYRSNILNGVHEEKNKKSKKLREVAYDDGNEHSVKPQRPMSMTPGQA